jgi:hypothetical protein
LLASVLRCRCFWFQDKKKKTKVVSWGAGLVPTLTPPSLVPVAMAAVVSAPRLPRKMSPMALFPLGMRVACRVCVVSRAGGNGRLTAQRLPSVLFSSNHDLS